MIDEPTAASIEPARPVPARRSRRRPGADARHLRRRDPGARGRRAHLLRLRHRHRRRDSDRRVPFALKLDMARQCWDEARHVEISVKLSDWMGTEIGQFAENTVLFEAACSTDPVLRLAGVNRALEGLAIDVFTTMKEFGDARRRPVPRVLRGLDAGRRGDPREDGLATGCASVTENDPERRKQGARVPERRRQAVQLRRHPRRTVDESPIGLARRFRELAGFTDDEIDDIAEVCWPRSTSARPGSPACRPTPPRRPPQFSSAASTAG